MRRHIAVAMTVRSGELARVPLTMTGTQIFAGRAAGVTWGYVKELKQTIVILATMVIETFLVLLFYSLFVLSYRKLIVMKPLKRTIAFAQQVAEARRGTIMKYGIPGLLLFVWFPFWLTGPLVGSVIGFLIGLRPKANIAVVLAGTCLAILCWGILLQRVHDALERLSPYMPVVFVGFILLVALSIHIRHAVSGHASKSNEPDSENGDQ